MNIDKRVLRCGAAAAITFVAWSGSYTAASGVRSYNGSDYAEDYDSKTNLRTCDEESDSTEVNGKYDFNSSGGHNGNVKDTDGNNNVCATGSTSGTIARHQTCETPDFLPDPCGNWQSTDTGK